MRNVIYMAHPVAPTKEEIELVCQGAGKPELWTESVCAKAAMSANIDRALRWLRWLRRSFPETTFIAPWIAAIQSGEDDADPAQREAGLVDCCAVVARCDGIVLVGGRISSGMRMEVGYSNGGFGVRDLTPARIDIFIRFPTWPVLDGRIPFGDWYIGLMERFL